jgi:transposase-like protein/Zn ribbon nucleic-acid-binding protein
MKTDLIPTPKDLTLDQINQRFADDNTAREYIESLLWPNGAVCPHCQNKDQNRIWKIKSNAEKKIRAGLHRCAECNKEFTVTVGTIFEDSHIPLRKWLIAFYMICSSKKGISSLQLQRNLGLGSYRTALFMTHRIRHAIQDPAFAEKLSGTVEVDETYVGGKQRGVGKGRTDNKTAVVSVLQRDGQVRSRVMPKVTGVNLKKMIREHVQICSDVNTDDHYGYRGLEPKFNHHVVKHSAKEYARPEGNRLVTTNGVEGFFSLLKRGVIGTFHHVSQAYLPLYLAEFDHRHNTRKLTDGERTVIGLKKSAGKRLTYRNPIGE